jgi:hypothetical protein
MALDVKAALALAPRGSRSLGELYFEIGENRVHTMAISTPTSVIIPLDAKLDDGGFVRATVEMDHRTYERAIGIAKKFGGLPVLSNAIERATNQHCDFRPLLPR